VGRADFGEVVNYVADYDGGQCFAAVPERRADGSLSVAAYAADNRASAAFEAGFAKAFGVAPNLSANQVATGQCSALDFIRDSRGYPEFRLGLTLHGAEVANSSLLAGQVDGATGLEVHLLIVDNDGMIASADVYRNRKGGDIAFAVPVTSNSPGATQLLLAIGVPPGLPDDVFAIGRSSADAFFGRLRAALAAANLSATLVFSPFVVD
jgi:serine/threonine-protein kinase